jgi:segregation and condensation protein A
LHLHFHLDRFDGPLGLLLYLIRKEEMDIFDINIHEITVQYLNYIKSLKNLDLEMAGEFVAMAATLIHIKSKMLLPNYSDSADEEAGEDPRKTLVQKLLEYEKFKTAAQQLNGMPLLNRDQWTREEKVDLNTYSEEEIAVSDRPLFSLIQAYRSTIGRVKKTVHKVGEALQSIAQRISEIKGLLRVGVRREFGELVLSDGIAPELRQGRVLITFLSLLELAKMGFVSLFQNDKETPIYVDAKKEIVDELLNGIEDYENPNEKPKTVASATADVWGQMDLDEQDSSEAVEAVSTEPVVAIDENPKVDSTANFFTTTDFNPLNLMEMPTETLAAKLPIIVEEAATDDDILQAELELEMLERAENEAKIKPVEQQQSEVELQTEQVETDDAEGLT